MFTSLKPQEVILAFDDELAVFTFRDTKEQLWLAYWCDLDPEGNLYLVRPINDQETTALREKSLPLKAFYQDADELYYIHREDEAGALTYRKLTKEEVLSEHWPEENLCGRPK